MTATRLELPGLDAQNPLAFFAALGLLRVLDESTGRDRRPQLSFEDRGAQVPVLESELRYDDIVSVVLEDAARWTTNPILRLAYADDGAELPPEDPKAKRDLKPSPALAREVLERAGAGERAGADFAAAMFSELVQDNKGNTKPTALHFTAGQQSFLGMVDDLRRGLTKDGLDEALYGPWRNTSTLPSLSWDASVTRLYALRAGNPSFEKRGSVPGANWLAVRGLAFFPVTVRRGRLVTTGVVGGWKDSVFRWPVWSCPSTSPVVASLLRLDVEGLTAKERAALGVSQVFGSRILRSDQGGYGSFAPAATLLPRRAP